MRFKWWKNKLTLLIIPEANADTDVVRIKLSHGALCATALIVLLLMGAASYIQITHFQFLASSFWSEAHSQARTTQLQQDIGVKNNTIEQLQNEVFQLSRQAEEIRAQMKEMKALELDLVKLSYGSETAETRQVQPAAAINQDIGGMGGPPFPVTLLQVQSLAQSVSASYSKLQQELDDQKSHYQQALAVKRDSIGQIPGLWPTESRTITSSFGYRRDPFTAKLSFHRGIDIAGTYNDPVRASAKGVAITVGYDKFHGHHIVLEHKYGFRTWYMHLNRILVKKGEHVEHDQEIGKLGSSGRSTGPHLHYEILLNGKSTDPKPYLPVS